MTDVPLHHGETLLAEWRPDFRVFARKLLFVGAITALILGGFGGAFGGRDDLFFWIASFPLVMAIYIFVFGDYDEWPRRRDDCWLLTNDRLIFRNTRDDTQNADVDLCDILRIRPWMGWALRVRLESRQAIVMAFLPDGKSVRATLQAAVDTARKGDAHDA
ncbi:hypothetical protein LCL97_13250 [Seohaeicola saemankumensis]|nr:hypothetical protein [Seohaeicola saemankumensis]MCA0871798.1 hypothetical protein [Seohaeicola saemankumensis]